MLATSKPLRLSSPLVLAVGTRRLEAGSQTCGTSCLVIGEPLEAGLATNGVLFQPTFTYRSMASSELQQTYYQVKPLIAPEGQSEIAGPRAVQAKVATSIAQYPKEVVSVIPPVVFQTRTELVPCNTFTPGIADSMDTYFRNQILGKCSSTYICDRDSGFSCIDRTRKVPASQRHYQTATVSMGGENWYPEFLDMFSVPVIYRGDIVNTADWLDLQTYDVLMINIFLAPSLQAGTTLLISFSYDGPGKMSGKTVFRPFVQMTPEDRDSWMFMNWMIFSLSILDIVLIVVNFVVKKYKKRRLFVEIPNMTQDEQDMIKARVKTWSPVDIFDLVFRAGLIAFCTWHNGMYPGPEDVTSNGKTVSTGFYEQAMKDILDLQWSDPAVTTEEKVDKFMTLVVDLNTVLENEDFHRVIAKFMILIFFIRIVIYMRVHPKIAVLYATIVEMAMDFTHFCIVFFALFGVLGYLAMWSFGDKMADFQDFGTSLYTQFRMLVGEFNMDTGADSGFDLVWGIWCVTYFLMVFSLLLNFFLAIVVDSYSTVKESVQKCQVESDVVTDIVTTFLYPIAALIEGWPSRGKIIQQLLRADLDQDGQNDEDDDKPIPITAEQLVAHEIVKGKKRSVAFMKWYKWVCPPVDFHADEHEMQLEHREIMKTEEVVDAMRCAKLGEKILAKAGPQKDPTFADVGEELKQELASVKTFIDEKELARKDEMKEFIARVEAYESKATELATNAQTVVRSVAQTAPQEAAAEDRSALASQLNTVMQLLEETQRAEAARREEARRTEERLTALIQQALASGGGGARASSSDRLRSTQAPQSTGDSSPPGEESTSAAPSPTPRSASPAPRRMAPRMRR